MANLWTYEQKFNDLNTAALSGQDSWTGTAGFDVVTTSPAEGAKCVGQPSGANWSDNTQRSITAVTSGTVYVSMKSEDTVGNGGGGFQLLNDSSLTDIIVLFWSDNTIRVLNDAASAYVQDGSAAWSADTWVRIGIAFECGAGAWEGLSAGYYKLSYDDGAWGSAHKMKRSSRTSIAGVWLYRMGSDASYFDYISPEYSSTEIKSVNGLAKSSIKSINGLAIASIKNFNGLA